MRTSFPTACLLVTLLLPAPLALGETPLHLPFWDSVDVRDVAGAKVELRAESLAADQTATGYPEMQFGCEAPLPDGSAWVYGWRMKNMADKPNRTLEVLRARTRDGLAFSDEEQLWSLKNEHWQGFANLVRRPGDGAIFLFAYSKGEVRVYRSDDGKSWQNLTDKAYVDHDSMSVTWYEPWGEFLNYQNTLEPYPKRYPDNVNNHRRVFSFRRSKDGVTWERFSPEFLHGEPAWRPDKDDPADLEFYRGVVFPTEGRYAMLIQDYLAPPPEANSRRATTKHGPRSAVEWAISRDGLNWARPFRDLDVSEKVGSLTVQGPLACGGKLRFYQPGGSTSALVEGRLFYAASRGNGEFSTVPFTMPATGLTLNVNALYRAVEGQTGTAYVMAELRDEQHQPLAGYERAAALIENVDGPRVPLRWGDKTGSELVGRTVELRFYLRDAKLYSVSAARLQPLPSE